jgi:hypothetical protein
LRTHLAPTLSACAVLAVLSLVASPAMAILPTVNLTDGNSTAAINLGSTPGLSSWTIDSNQMLGQQSFWYRIGPSGPASSLNSLTLQTTPSATSDVDFDGFADTFYARYASVGSNSFTIDVRWSLAGGLSGSHVSDIAEVVTVNNLGGTALDFHLFEFTNFQLPGGANTAMITGTYGATAEQSAGNWSAEVVHTRPSEHQVGLVGDPTDILAALTSAGLTNLSNSNGPMTGDAQWAMQWDANLLPGQTLLMSNDARITPEPATLTLLGAGALVGWMMRRRRGVQ